MTLRPARPDDYPSFARLFPELATGDAVPSVELFTREIVPRAYFLEEQGEVLGYAYVETFRGTGYVRHVVVDPRARGKRLGRALMQHVATELRAAGCASWCLNVREDNLPALRLYGAVGMKRLYDSHVLRLSWDALPALPPSPAELACTSAHDEDALEAAFQLPPGSLAAYKRSPLFVVLRLTFRHAPHLAKVGVARFTPSFPGAFPFRVADPSFARALLTGMLPHRRPEHTYVQLVTEDDGPLTRLLLAAGAEHRFAMQHFGGPLA